SHVFFVPRERRFVIVPRRGSRGRGRMVAALGHEREDCGGQLGHFLLHLCVLRGDDVIELPFVQPLVGGIPSAGDRHEHHEGGQSTLTIEDGGGGGYPDAQLDRQQAGRRAERPARNVEGR